MRLSITFFSCISTSSNYKSSTVFHCDTVFDCSCCKIFLCCLKKPLLVYPVLIALCSLHVFLCEESLHPLCSHAKYQKIVIKFPFSLQVSCGKFSNLYALNPHGNSREKPCRYTQNFSYCKEELWLYVTHIYSQSISQYYTKSAPLYSKGVLINQRRGIP